MTMITVFTTKTCAFCPLVTSFLAKRGVPFEIVSLEDSPNVRQELINKTGYMTVPIITNGSDEFVVLLDTEVDSDTPDVVCSRVLAELAAEHEKISGGVARAIEIGVVDEIIEPTATRSALAKAILAAPARRGAHGNIPL